MRRLLNILWSHKVTILIYSSSLIVTNRCIANPFINPYVLSLENLGFDGDLRYRLEICRWKLGRSQTISVDLTHEMQSADFGESRSEMKVRPFETAVTEVGPGLFRWLSPGGTKVTFSKKISAEQSDHQFIEREYPSSIYPLIRVFENNGLKFYVTQNLERCSVVDEGWVLNYNDGHLLSFSSPEGEMFDAISSGKMIRSISQNKKILLEIIRDDLNRLQKIKLGETTYLIGTNSDGLISSVVCENNDWSCALIYNADHLLESVSLNRRIIATVSWHSVTDYVRGDTLYMHPFSVAGVNETAYEYAIRGEIVSMKAKRGKVLFRQIDIGLSGGKIRWVRNFN